MSNRKNLQLFTLYHFSFYSNQDELECSRKQKLFLKLKSNMGLDHVVLTTPKTCPEKLTLTLVKKPLLLDDEGTDSKEELCCLKMTTFIGRRKVCVNFKTDKNKWNFVVYRYRNNLYLKDKEVDLKLTYKQSVLAKRVCIFELK